jgi:hypothetical protein
MAKEVCPLQDFMALTVVARQERVSRSSKIHQTHTPLFCAYKILYSVLLLYIVCESFLADPPLSGQISRIRVTLNDALDFTSFHSILLFFFLFHFVSPYRLFQGLEQKEAVQSGSVSYASRLVCISVLVLPVFGLFGFVTGVFWVSCSYFQYLLHVLKWSLYSHNNAS